MDEIYTNWESGRVNVFYQNSIISRGLDIPFYHTTFVYSCNFATPYWTAVRNHLQEMLITPAEDGADQDAEQKKYNAIKERVDEITRIITKIQMDETTNGILRTAPVPGRYEDHVKLVIFSEKHAPLVAGARCNGVTTIPIATTTPIEPLVGIFRRLVDPVVCTPANTSIEHLTLRPFKPAGIPEAKDIIAQYMSNYEEAVESYNLPIEKVGTVILQHVALLAGRRISETALIAHILEKVNYHIGKKNIRKVIQRMIEGNILKSSISDSGALHRMYHINLTVLAAISDEQARSPTITALLSVL